MKFAVGDRVWWKHTESNVRRGLVHALEDNGMIGVQLDEDASQLIYIDPADHVYREIPVEDGIYSGIDDISYHADPDSLSSSGARALLAPSSPEIFRYERQQPPNPKPEYDFGHGAHYYVLGEGSEIVEVKFDNWQKKDAQAAREEAWANGQVPLLTKDVKKAKAMADAVMRHPLARALFEADGQAELSGYWHDIETGTRLRYRTDRLCELGGRVIGVDYKSTADAHPASCAKSAGNFGYHQQHAWYEAGLIATEVSDDPDFLLVFQSKKPPFPVSVARIKPHHVDLGRRRNREAINLYTHCVSTDTWPGFGDHIHNIEIPSYAAYRQEAELTA
jgi:hypothetical protein